MKNSKKCPKCQHTNIARVEGKAGAYGSGNVIHTGLTTFSAVNVTRFVCLRCGFVEEWIESKDDLERIKTKFM